VRFSSGHKTLTRSATSDAMLQRFKARVVIDAIALGTIA
jgi:hypothetical protein